MPQADSKRLSTKLVKLRQRAVLLLSGAAFVAFIMLSYVYQKNREEFAPSKLDRLVMKLEGNYRRHLDQNRYSFNYRGVEPNTLVIIVRHFPDVNRNQMNAAIESAKSMVKGLARDYFHLPFLNISVEVTQLNSDKKD